jgi:hypothetical protein
MVGGGSLKLGAFDERHHDRVLTNGVLLAVHADALHAG